MGKVWLVTGASRGLGREITRAALDAGETVVATARSADAVRDACGGEHDRLHALALDITDAEAAHSVAAESAERFGAIDVLVNNAGYAELGFFETFTDAAVRRQFEVNLFGTMNVARAVAPHMRARRSGLIVTISSISGLVSNGGGGDLLGIEVRGRGMDGGLRAGVGTVGRPLAPGRAGDAAHRLHGRQVGELRQHRHSRLCRGDRAVSRVRGRGQRQPAGRSEAACRADRGACFAGRGASAARIRRRRPAVGQREDRPIAAGDRPGRRSRLIAQTKVPARN
ncbi:SDR family NAD(P)-dependent oxidoreductase [Xanthomonas arboricola pv. corylina]|nr:SDR family NAD(P)-dependent oxidoreductase [Xanthomonas arboricola pv. corylina]